MYYKKLRSIFSKKQMRRLVGVIMILIFGAMLETFSVTMILPFMNTLITPDSVEMNGTLALVKRALHINEQNMFLAMLALFIVCVYLIKGVYAYCQNKIIYNFVYSNWQQTSTRLFECYINKPYIYHRRKNSADIVRSVTTDVTNLFTLVQNAMNFISEGLTTMFMLLFMLILDPLIAAMSFISLGGLLIITNKLISPLIVKRGICNQNANALMIKWCNQSMGGIKEIKTQKREHHFLTEYTKCSAEAADAQKDYYILLQIPKVLIESVSISIIFAIMAFLLFRGEDLVSRLPVFATFAMAAVRLMPSVNRMNAAVNTMSYHKASLDVIYNDLLDSGMGSDYVMDPHTVRRDTAARNSLPLKIGIKVVNMTFRFPDDEHYLFNNISLNIPAGKSVAFIGTTGSGKTTLADIILGLYDVEKGSVIFDNKSIFEYSDEWAGMIGYIPQFIYLCDDTIRNNIAFGLEETAIDDKNIWSCLEEAHIKDFIESLPDGLDTVVGEQGIRLSGGQRQRIGIARALYSSPQFIVMDEATSALDTETEQAIIDTINLLSRTKTLLIIAHRLSTIQACDIIYRIEKDGIKIEKGIENSF